MLCEAFKKKSTKIILVQGFYAPAKIATFFAILKIFVKTAKIYENCCFSKNQQNRKKGAILQVRKILNNTIILVDFFLKASHNIYILIMCKKNLV